MANHDHSHQHCASQGSNSCSHQGLEKGPRGIDCRELCGSILLNAFKILNNKPQLPHLVSCNDPNYPPSWKTLVNTMMAQFPYSHITGPSHSIAITHDPKILIETLSHTHIHQKQWSSSPMNLKLGRSTNINAWIEFVWMPTLIMDNIKTSHTTRNWVPSRSRVQTSFCSFLTK